MLELRKSLHLKTVILSEVIVQRAMTCALLAPNISITVRLFEHFITPTFPAVPLAEGPDWYLLDMDHSLGVSCSLRAST